MNEINELNGLITEEHRELIRKKITKVIKEMDVTKIVHDFIENEFEYASETCVVVDSIKDEINEVIHQHLIKSGLLQDRK